MTALPRPATRSTRAPHRVPTARPGANRTGAAARSASRPTLRVVQTRDAKEHSGVGFVVTCVLLLVGGLIALLLLNTERAQQSFAIDKLQAKSALMTDQQQALSAQVDDLSAPQELARRAQEMGLVTASKVKYVRKSDGKVLGESSPSGGGQQINVGTLPSTPASRAAAKGVTAANLGLVVTDEATVKKQAAAKAKAAAKKKQAAAKKKSSDAKSDSKSSTSSKSSDSKSSDSKSSDSKDSTASKKSGD